MGDLNARRGRVQGTEPVGDGEQEIIALVPTSEILRYAIDLRSMTGGRGRFTAEHDHYDVLPSHLVDKVREAEGRDALSDLSPADAVVAARSFAAPSQRGNRGSAATATERSPSAIRSLASQVATVLDDTTRRLGGAPPLARPPTRSRPSPRRRTRSSTAIGTYGAHDWKQDRGGTPAIEVLRSGVAEAGGLVRKATGLTERGADGEESAPRCRNRAVSAVVRFESPPWRRRGGTR